MPVHSETVGLLLAGGVGSRLNILGAARAKPAIPFAGMYRIIDFTLSSAMTSGITNVGVLTQYKPFSLMAHIGTGASWDFIGRNRGLRILPPHTREKDHDWYRGTADAVWQNWGYVNSFCSTTVLILSGDHIYSMDYSRMLRFHREKKADLTLAVMPIEPSECRHFGMVHVDGTGRIVGFEEKPARSESRLASMGVYAFATGVLGEELATVVHKGRGRDFGKDVIPGMLSRRSLYAYRFDGYWRDVGTIRAYWDAHMDLLDPRSGLDLASWSVFTNPDDRSCQDRPPARVGAAARLDAALVSRGCTIEGTVTRSVLSPGVVVEKGAIVRRSVILHDTRIGPGAVVDFAIVDKDVAVGRGARVGHGRDAPPNERHPDHLDCGIALVGKAAEIPAGIVIGRNCIIRPGAHRRHFPARAVAAGSTVEVPEEG
jgi:glucose-1-phosphate adenylyltransferase